MIVQEITPYSRPIWTGYTSHYHQNRHSQQQQVLQNRSGSGPHAPAKVIPIGYNNPNAMGKLEYSLFLQNLKLKVGDMVASMYASKPYHARGVYRIQDIDEIHHYVQWGTKDVGPLCLNLQSCIDGVMPHKGGANMWVKVADEDLPLVWKEWLVKHDYRKTIELVKDSD